MSAAVQLGGVSNRGLRHLGVLRAVANVPAIVGSVGILLVFLTFLGRWEPAAILSWLAVGFALLTRPGEQLAVSVAWRFRRPSAEQGGLLHAPWQEAVGLAGLAPENADLFIRREAAPNAYAVGRRSVAVTSELFEDFLAQRLRREHLTAVLLHELGHVQEGHERLTLAVTWLRLPRAAAARALNALVLRVAPVRGQTSTIATVGLATAVAQSVRVHAWDTAAILIALLLAGVLCPVGGAALRRHAEFAADRFAAMAGVGPWLVEALILMSRDTSHDDGTGRLTSSHPPLDRRVSRLLVRQ